MAFNFNHFFPHSRSGLIQPGVVGEDGRVRPVEHVLELVQNVADEQVKSDDDSD